jgi:hypothetical protein
MIPVGARSYAGVATSDAALKTRAALHCRKESAWNTGVASLFKIILYVFVPLGQAYQYEFLVVVAIMCLLWHVARALILTL